MMVFYKTLRINGLNFANLRNVRLSGLGVLTFHGK